MTNIYFNNLYNFIFTRLRMYYVSVNTNCAYKALGECRLANIKMEIKDLQKNLLHLHVLFGILFLIAELIIIE